MFLSFELSPSKYIQTIPLYRGTSQKENAPNPLKATIDAMKASVGASTERVMEASKTNAMAVVAMGRMMESLLGTSIRIGVVEEWKHCDDGVETEICVENVGPTVLLDVGVCVGEIEGIEVLFDGNIGDMAPKCSKRLRIQLVINEMDFSQERLVFEVIPSFFGPQSRTKVWGPISPINISVNRLLRWEKTDGKDESEGKILMLHPKEVRREFFPVFSWYDGLECCTLIGKHPKTQHPIKRLQITELSNPIKIIEF